MKIPSFNEYLNLNESKQDLSFKDWFFESPLTALFENAGGQGAQIRAKVAAMSRQEAETKAEKIMEMCHLKIFSHYPMFRPFLKIMPPIAKHGAGSVGPDGIGTMSTSGSAIFYDPKFVVYTYELGKVNFAGEVDDKIGALRAIREGRRYPSDYATFVVIHEIMHNSLKHFLRQPPPSDYLTEAEIHQLWNIATDYEINHILKSDPRSGLIAMFPGGVDADEGAFKAPEGEEEFFKTASAEKIFWRLLKNLEEKRREEQGEDEQEGGGEDEGEEQEGENGGEDQGENGEEGGDEGQEGEGEDEGDGGEGEGGSGGSGGTGGGGDSSGEDGGDGPLKPGDIIMDHETGGYGRVTSVSGDDVEFDEISKEEAMKILGK